MQKLLQPAIGTRLTDSGIVTSHDVTRFGLHRMAVEAAEKYPPLQAWMKMIGNPTNWTHFYTEREGKGFTGVLLLYWKETK